MVQDEKNIEKETETVDANSRGVVIIAMNVATETKKKGATVAQMIHRNNKILVLLGIFVFFACDGRMWHEFKNVDGEWLRNDTLRFSYYDAGEGDDCHTLCVELRSMYDYCYKDVRMQVVADSKSYDAPIVDTLSCRVYDDNGVYMGTTNGIMYQLSSQNITLPATPHDTLYVSINHIMNDTLHGISDVGVRLLHCGRHQYAGN